MTCLSRVLIEEFVLCRGPVTYTFRDALTRMRSGETDRAIARSGLMDRRRAAALRRVAESAGWLDTRRALPDESLIAHVLEQSGPMPASPAPVSRAAPVPAKACDAAAAWYVGAGQQGQQLLEAGRVAEAIQVFEDILPRLGGAPSYGRAVVLGRLGHCLRVAGRSADSVERLREAIAVTARLADNAGVASLCGVLHADLGEALRGAGQLAEAQRALELALAIAETAGDLRGQAVDLAQLGALAFERGRTDEAMLAYQGAIARLRMLGDRALLTVALLQSGRACQQAARTDEAHEHYREAVTLAEALGDRALAARGWLALSQLDLARGRPASAEAWLRRTVDADREAGDAQRLACHLRLLAVALQDMSGRREEARALIVEALLISQQHDPTSPDAWLAYGVFSDLLDREAAELTNDAARTAVQSQAARYREVARHAPRVLAALARAGQAPGHARAVLVWNLARCFRLGDRPDIAAQGLPTAVTALRSLAPDAVRDGLLGVVQAELGDLYRDLGRHDEARAVLDEALSIAVALDDVRSQALHHAQRGALAAGNRRLGDALAEYDEALRLCLRLDDRALGDALRAEAQTLLHGLGHLDATVTWPADAQRRISPGVTVCEALRVEYVFDGDLLIDGRHLQRVFDAPAALPPLPSDARPVLPPLARCWADEAGTVHIALTMEEPAVERLPGCIVMHRRVREVAVSDDVTILWQLLSRMDGWTETGALIAAFEPATRAGAATLLAKLAAAGMLDLSGRVIGRFLHGATRKGTVPAGGLGDEQVLELATDGCHRSYPDAPRMSLETPVPERLRAFHALTRARRSRRDYQGAALRREDFAALLDTACGVTGVLPWGGRELKLRAYPASGALYAVELYPVLLRVEGVDPGIYHYLPRDAALERLHTGFDAARYLQAMLPIEREMVAGAAAMICLTGVFPRHERKYGQGGYRMMVAEAGHISQNLVLAATALGLAARPFGGVFDALINRDLGFDNEDEQFLLSVLVGHAGVHEQG